MNLRQFRLAPIALGLLGVTQTHAAGIGELNVASRLGQPLRAEVRIISTPDESIRASCFRLVPAEEAGDIPALTRARMSLQTRNGQSFLIISTTEPMADPILTLTLQAGCDMGLTREFTLLLPAPAAEDLPYVAGEAGLARPSSADAAEKPQAAISQGPATSSAGVGAWQVAEGESLRTVAESLYPNDKRSQRRFVTAAVAANPAVFPGGIKDAGNPLPAGTRLQIPSMKAATAEPAAPRRAAPRPSKPATVAAPAAPAPDGGVLAALPDRPHPLLQKMQQAQPEGDRLQVGSKPVAPSTVLTDAKQRERAREQQLIMDLEDKVSAYQEVLDRIKKLEAHEAELKVELGRLDAALGEAEKAAATQPETTAATPVAAPAAQPATTAPVPTVTVDSGPLPPPPSSALPEWLIALISGGAAVALMVFLTRSRRKGGASAPQHVTNPTLPLPSEGVAATAAAEAGTGDTLGVPAEEQTETSNIVRFAPSTRDDDIIDVAEHESAMELAEIMLSFGRLKGAAQTLADFVEANPKQSIEPWLKLLEIYREAGMKREFETTSKRLNHFFNVGVIAWEETDSDAGIESLEKFSHIRDRLTSTWGTPDCLEYLQKLLMDNRSGSRSGFSLTVLDEILFLISILDQQRNAAKHEKVGRAA